MLSTVPGSLEVRLKGFEEKLKDRNSPGQEQSFQSDKARRWIFAECEYAERSRELRVRGKPVKAEGKPLDVLQALLERPTRVVTKQEIVDLVWGVNAAITDYSLATAISSLRKYFGGERNAIIVNVSGVGYKMAVPVICVEDEEEEEFVLQIEPGKPLPHWPDWKAVTPLGIGERKLVWLAERTDREISVFKFALDGIRLRALQREIEVSKYLRETLRTDDRFVRVLDSQTEKPPFSIRAEYWGENLFEFAEREEFAKSTQDQRIALAAEIADAVAAAHSRGVWHNDLKPSNVLVFPGPGNFEPSRADRSPWDIKIADFGIATVSEPQRLRELHITYHETPEDLSPHEMAKSGFGTAVYRAPELFSGSGSGQLADVYALGVMLYQIICGDFLQPLSPGWEARIADPLLRKDIADAANVDPKLRIQHPGELARRLREIAARRLEEQRREEERARAERAERHALSLRAWRRSLVVLAAGLAIAFCAILWFYSREVQARNLAEKRSNTLAKMYNFVAHDLLEQTDPTVGSGQRAQETLLEAIDNLLPQIDRRFHEEPEIAGRLHETVADALNDRTQFPQAKAQYIQAAEWLRKAQGPLSQDALIADLKLQSMQTRSGVPSDLEAANRSFAQDQQVLPKIAQREPELDAWIALTRAALLGSTTHPQDGIPILKAAISKAESGGLSSSTLFDLRQRLLYLYIRTGDGSGAETEARDLIRSVARVDGPNSPALLMFELNLEEALYIESKYKDAIEQGTRIYPQFAERLGNDNQLTIQVIATRAAAEGELGLYEASIRDELAVHDAEGHSASGTILRIGSLDDGAISECRIGRFASGVAHARQALQESRSGNGMREELISGSESALAECLVSQVEAQGWHAPRPQLQEIAMLLGRINVQLLSHFMGNPGFEGDVDLNRARLAYAEGNLETAQQWLTKARPFFEGPHADKYYKHVLETMSISLAGTTRHRTKTATPAAPLQ